MILISPVILFSVLESVLRDRMWYNNKGVSCSKLVLESCQTIQYLTVYSLVTRNSHDGRHTAIHGRELGTLGLQAFVGGC